MLESLGCSQILPGMSGPRLEADEAMTVQQLGDPVKRAGLAELAIQDPLDLRPSERCHAMSWHQPSLVQRNGLLLGRQSSLPTGCRATTHRLDAAITMGVRPTLHESATAGYDVSNFQRLPPQQHQQHAP